MRRTALPANQRLHLLRDALSALDPRRHPGVKAETAAMLCETLLDEGARQRDRRLVAEAALVSARAITTGPLPACTRHALVTLLGEAVNALSADGEGRLVRKRHRRARPCEAP